MKSSSDDKRDAALRSFFSWRFAVIRSDLPSTTKHVLLTLAVHMNDAGEGPECFPSIDTLCQETSLSNRAVITHLYKAVEDGWIAISNQGAGQGWRHHRYHLRWPEKVMNHVHQLQTDVVNLVPERGERPSKNVVNDVHSNSTVLTLQETLEKDSGLPPWLPLQAWNDFREMRKKSRHPLTDRAEQLAVLELNKLRKAGESVEAVLNQSILRGWRGLFAVHENGAGGAGEKRKSFAEQRSEKNKAVLEQAFGKSGLGSPTG